jgi:ASTRA-associated protein 1
MDMSALNFCAFATCDGLSDQTGTEESSVNLLVAGPNGIDSGGIDIFQLPTQRRVSQLHSDKDANTGMVMAIVLYHSREARTLHLLSGYEDGHVMLHLHRGALDTPSSNWERLLTFKAHSQPVLALGLSPNKEYVLSSSADARIQKLALPETPEASVTVAAQAKSINTKHAGQQGLSVRSDGQIFATAGWDSRVRVYSTKALKELAVLKWHQDGCYSTAFAEISNTEEPNGCSQEVAAMSALDMIKHERSLMAQRIHWLAAGGKDGKISLWNIY